MKDSPTMLARNGAWSLLNQVVRVGSLALVIIALGRHFGPQRFGSLAVGLALVRIFAVVASFGLDRVIVRRLVDEEERGAAITREAFWLKLAIAFVTYVAMLGLILIFQRNDSLLFAIAALAGGGLLFQACDVFDYTFQAHGQFRLSFFGRGVPILLSTALKLAAIFANAPLLVFAALETVEAAIIGVALFLVYRRTMPRVGGATFGKSIAWPRLVAEGLPLLLSALAVMIYMRSDIIMLGKMAGYHVAGIYAAASQTSEACALFPVALMPALFPILARWRRRGPEFYHRQFERLFLLAVATGLLFSLTLTVGATTIVTFIFGSNYHSAANILVIHGWTILFIFIGITQSGYDVTEGLTWFATFRTFVGALLNIGLNLILIPRHGAVGSAVATLVAQIFSSVLLNALHPRTRPILRMQLMSILLVPALRAVYGNERARQPANWQEIGNRVTLADG
jgi:PST family polysaccharide transporter